MRGIREGALVYLLVAVVACSEGDGGTQVQPSPSRSSAEPKSPPSRQTETVEPTYGDCRALARYLERDGFSHHQVYDPEADLLIVYGVNGREFHLSVDDSRCIRNSAAVGQQVCSALHAHASNVEHPVESGLLALGEGRCVLHPTPEEAQCQPVTPRALPSGAAAGTSRAVGPRTVVWGRGPDRVAQRIGGDPLGALPDWPSYQTAALRGTKTLIKIVPIGDPGQIALVFTLTGCSYTTWIGPGITVQEARHYAASF